MSAFSRLNNILNNADADSQDWTEWQVFVADEVISTFGKEDIEILQNCWKLKKEFWKEAMIDVITGLPNTVFAPILLEIICTEGDDLGWKAADACGFYAKYENFASYLKNINAQEKVLCVLRLNNFIEKKYLRTDKGEDIRNLRDLLL